MAKIILTLGIVFYNIFIYSQDYNEIGIAQMKEKRFPEAIYYFNKAIDMNSGNSIYFLNRGYCYFQIEDYMKAKDDFSHCSEIIPEEPEYYYLIGLCYDKLNNIDTAILNYNRAITLNDNNYEYYYRRGIAYMKIDSFSKSIEEFDASLKLNPAHSSSYYNRGQSKYKLEQIDNACLDWQVSLVLDSSLTIKQFEKNCNEINFNSWEDVKSLSKNDILEEPHFQDGDINMFRKYIAENIRYPAYELENFPQGRVIYKFIIKANGEIDDITTIASVSQYSDNEVKRVIELTRNMWDGGRLNGIPIDFEYTFSILFLDITFFEKIRDLEKKAEDAYKNKDYVKAIQHYNEILNIDSLDSKTLRKRAISKDKLGGIEDAEIDWKAVENFDEKKYKYSIDFIFSYVPKKHIRKDEKITIYYDSIWQITMKENAFYYRISKWNNKKSFYDGNYKDFFINGTLYAEGFYFDSKKEGRYVSYYKNGSIQSEGKFKDNELDSVWLYYYSNGVQKHTIDFFSHDFIIKELYDSTGNSLFLNGTCDFHILFKNNYELAGTYLEGKRSKKWKFLMNNRLVLEEIYKKNVYKRGIFYSKGQKHYPIENNIRSWIFVPSHLSIIENLVFDNEETKKYYKFIKKTIKHL